MALNFILGRTVWHHQRLPVHEGEAIALLEAVMWIIDLGLQYVVLESDWKMVVDHIHKNQHAFSKFATIINHCTFSSSFL